MFVIYVQPLTVANVAMIISAKRHLVFAMVGARLVIPIVIHRRLNAMHVVASVCVIVGHSLPSVFFETM
jgi:hypothetical protein